MKITYTRYPAAILENPDNKTVLCRDDVPHNAEPKYLSLDAQIVELRSDAFANLCGLEELSLHRGITVLGDALFSTFATMRIRYEGDSTAFLALAAPVITQEYVSGPYDHYPYYSDAGASYRDEVRAFDNKCAHIEVFCEADGVYLYYGQDNKKPEDTRPASREDYLARMERARQAQLCESNKLLRFLEDAELVSVSFVESVEVDVIPCLGTFALIDDRLCFAVRAQNALYRAAERKHPIAIFAAAGDRWISVRAIALSLEDEDDIIDAMRARFSLPDRGYDYICLGKVIVKLRDKHMNLLSWKNY